jgi:hypothetical protein
LCVVDSFLNIGSSCEIQQGAKLERVVFCSNILSFILGRRRSLGRKPN